MEENMKNMITRMIMDSDIVYVDGMTIKDRYCETTHSNVKNVMKNINKYYITSFNRNGKRCLRYLELNSEYVI